MTDKALQNLWGEVRADKKKSERLMAECYALLGRYRMTLAGRELANHSLGERIRALQAQTDRAATIIYAWIDPRPQMSEWYQRMDRRYGRPTWFLEKGDNWLWLHVVAPIYLGWKRLTWRWERRRPRGDMAVVRRGHSAIKQLIAEQMLLRGFLQTAIQPANHHEVDPELARQRDAARRRLQLENPPPSGLRLEATYFAPEADGAGPIEVASSLEQAQSLQRQANSWDPEQEVPAGFVRVGPFGTIVHESLAETWRNGDKWKEGG